MRWWMIVAIGFVWATVDIARAEEKPRNVVLIVADDLGFQLGCYGNNAIDTPGIDRLAASGTRFTHAYCTTASCSASRSVLMSGLYNHATGHYGHAHGYNHFSTYETVKSLPVILSEAGYRTCSIGKYHLAPEYIYHFDEYRNDGVQGNRNAVRMAANAKEWLHEESDKPFFLYWCSSDPHRGGGPGGFANFNNDPDHYPGVEPVKYDPAKVKVPDWLPDTPQCRQELAEYYQAINRFDQGVNDLLDAIEATGHRDDTLILLTSDNGPPFPGAKTCLYNPGMNLPLIVRSPDQKTNGGTTDAKVVWVDMVPTILDFCGVTPALAPPIRTRENTGKPDTSGRPQPVTFHGRSFLSVLDQTHPEGFDTVFASHTFHEITMYYPMRLMIKGKYKFTFNVAHQLPYPFASDLYSSPTWQSVLNSDTQVYGKRTVYAYLHRSRFELYDLEADPDEIKNLANDPQYQEVLNEMQSAVQKWQKETGDPWELKWRYE